MRHACAAWFVPLDYYHSVDSVHATQAYMQHSSVYLKNIQARLAYCGRQDYVYIPYLRYIDADGEHVLLYIDAVDPSMWEDKVHVDVYAQKDYITQNSEKK